MKCLDCGRAMRTWRSKPDGRRRSVGRGLCETCHQRHRNHGTLSDFERRTRPADEVLEDWDFLRHQGYSIRDAAERMGMTHAALDKALYRAARRGDPRARRPGQVVAS